MRILFLYFFFVGIVTHAQLLQLSWEQNLVHLQGTSTSQSVSVDESNNVFVLAEENFPAGDGVVVKLGPQGDTLITLSYGDDFRTATYGSPCLVTEDQNLIIAGARTVNDSTVTVIKKISLDGQLEWTQLVKLSGRNEIIPRDLLEGNNLILIADASDLNTTINAGGGAHFSVHSLSLTGDLYWSKMFYGEIPGVLYGVEGHLANSILRTLVSWSEDSVQSTICDINATGSIENSHNYYGAALSDDTVHFSFLGGLSCNNETGDCFISGHIETPAFSQYVNAYVFKVNELNEVEWIYYEPTNGTYSAKVAATADGGVAFYTQVNGAQKAKLVRFSSDGAVIDSLVTTVSCSSLGDVREIVLHDDSCLYIASTGGGHGYVAKYSGVGAPAPTGIDDNNPILQSSISFYPNPFVNNLSVESQTEGTVQLFDNRGVLLREEQIDQSLSWSLDDFKPGGYTYKFITKTFVQSGSLVKVE